MKEFDSDAFKAKEQATLQPSKAEKGIWAGLVTSIAKKVSSKKELKTYNLDDLKKILLQQGCTEDQWTYMRDIMQKLFKMLGNDLDWSSFLSKEIIWEEKTEEEKQPVHHAEVRFIEAMFFELSDFITPEELMKLVNTLNKEDVVAFVKDLRAKGRHVIIERLEEKEAEKFEIDKGSQFWKFSDTQSLSMDEYLGHCADRNESSGRLLVHVTQAGLFKMLLGKPKLVSSVRVHLKGEKHLKKVSEELDKGVNDLYKSTHALSLGVHFSCDNEVLYPSGRYAAVFAAEALYNNYAFARISGDADITIAGKSNDLLNDPSHEIDVLKYGFFLAPEEDRIMVEQEFEKNSCAARPRIFFYNGSLMDGMEQLRAKIGKAEDKTRLRKPPLVQRGIDLGFSQAIGQNNSLNARAKFSQVLQMASEANEKGENFYPDISKFKYWDDSWYGQGIYFSV